MADLEHLRKQIQGPVFSVVTPFKKDDSVDYDALERYLERIYLSGGRIFYVMGYNSRFSELSWREIKQLNGFVTNTVKQLDSDNIVIVADPLHCPTTVSIKFCEHAEKIGADVISLIVREKYYSDQQIVAHFRMCAERVGIGVLVHEMPFLSGLGGGQVNYSVDLLDRLADIENVIAVKEDAKDDAYSREVIERVRDRLAVVISGGGKRQWLRFSECGCQAWLNGIGVFEPALPVRFWLDYRQGRMSECQAMIDEVEVPFFEQVVGKYGWHLSIKAALEARGIMSRHERMPLLAVRASEAEEIKKIVNGLPLERFVAATSDNE